VFETTQNWRAFHWGRVPLDLWVILETSEDAKRPTLTAFDPLKGKHKLLRTIKKDPRSDNVAEGVSPDGLTFAIAISFETEIHIRLLSLAHGSDREIAVKGWPDITGLDWSADGKGFCCGSTSPQGGALLYVDLPGTAHVL
jgi:hypothetical protein